mgnify:CR=1 FL=1
MKKYLLFLMIVCAALQAEGQSLTFAFPIGGGNNEDEATAVATDANGNVYVTGGWYGTADFNPGSGTNNLSNGTGMDIFVAKYDANGNYVWAKQIGGASLSSKATSIAVDAAGNVYTAGYFNGTVDFNPGAGSNTMTSSSQDAFISKLDANGNYVWAIKIAGTSQEQVNDIAIDASGNLVVTGWFYGTVDFDPGAGTVALGNTAGSDIFVAKYDSNGALMWAKQLGGTSANLSGNSIAVDATGNVYTTGYFQTSVDFDPDGPSYVLGAQGVLDVFVSKLDVNGNFVWAKSIGGTGADDALGIDLDATGNVYLTGYFEGTCDFDPGSGTAFLSNSAGLDIYVCKLNNNGDYVWAKQIGGSNIDCQGNSVKVGTNGQVYTTGVYGGTVDFDPSGASFQMTAGSTIGNVNPYISILDANGNFAAAYTLSCTDISRGNGIALDASGAIVSVGNFVQTIDFDPGAGTLNASSLSGTQDFYVHKMIPCIGPLAPINTTNSANLTICNNTSTTLTATGIGTLGWYTASSGGTYLGGGSTFTTANLTVNTNFFVQDSTCGPGGRTQITVFVEPPIAATFSAVTNVTCNGGADGLATATPTSGTGPFTYSWSPSGGTAATATGLGNGTYTCTITDANGCIGSSTVSITQPAAIVVSQSVTLCAGQTLTVGSNTYSSTGVYTDVLASVNGCDSTVTTNLTYAAPIDVSTSVSLNTITAVQSGGTYQWIDCLNNNAPVAGATSQSFTPSAVGDYAVIITIGNCSDTSACVSFSTGINDVPVTAVNVYPNPTNGELNVELFSNSNDAIVNVYSVAGQLILAQRFTTTKTTLQLPEANGVYIVEVITNGQKQITRVIKH